MTSHAPKQAATDELAADGRTADERTANQTVRIGIVGTENTHVDHMIRYLNIDQARPGFRVVGLAGGPAERTDALAADAAIEHVVDSVEDLLDHADALVVADRHGGKHLAHARPFLELGRPVLVDKPLACEVADAEAMLSLAAATGAPLTSYSTLRYVPDTEKLIDRISTLGTLQAVVLSGPADPASEHGGIFFYGVHMVDIALRLAGSSPGAVRVQRTPSTVVATCLAGAVHVTVHFVTAPGATSRIPFHALAVGDEAIASSEIGTPGNYVAYGLDVFLDMIATGQRPLTDDDMLDVVRFLATVNDAL
jgi:predicted dehydrogenase